MELNEIRQHRCAFADFELQRRA